MNTDWTCLTMISPEFSYHTQSLCPVCLKRIEAWHTIESDTVFLEKNCPDHGPFKVKIWQGIESYAQWIKPKIPIKNRFSMTVQSQGCPFDCGLCPDHTQHTCTAVLEVTQACNFNCRFCFANAGHTPKKAGADLSLDRISALLKGVQKVSPGCNLQISGGEPTVRPDLDRIIALARQTGFGFVQLNTNGYLLARTPGLASRLARAGLSSVFLQFDGTCDRTYQHLRGRPLTADKHKAVSACIENRIGVILVPTLVPGVNIDQIGPILRFALDMAPGVRGVHFQPVSYFGRIDRSPLDTDRITLPEVLKEIETQTRGMFRQKDFKPSSCEHALCSFTGKFLVRDDKSLSALTLFTQDCCTPVQAEQGSMQAKASVARHWISPVPAPAAAPKANPGKPGKEDGLDRFIQQARSGMFSVSGMAFQDAWNIDIQRLRGCCIHSVARDGRLIPFCAYNLTRADGKGLYRNP